MRTFRGDSYSYFRLVWGLVFPQRWLIAAALVAGGITAAATAGFAVLAGPALRLISGEHWQSAAARRLPFGASTLHEALRNAGQPLMVLAALVLCLAFVRSTGQYLHQAWLERAAGRAIGQLREDCFTHVTRLTPAALQDQSEGGLLARLALDTVQARWLFGAAVGKWWRDGLTLMALAAVMWQLQPRLAVLALAVLPVFVIVLLQSAKQMGRHNRSVSARWSAVLTRTQAVLGAVPLIRNYHGEREHTRLYAADSRALEEAELASRKTQAAHAAVLELMAAVTAAALLLALAWQQPHLHLSPSALASFVAAALLVYRPFVSLAAVAQQIATGGAALQRIHQLLNATTEAQTRSAGSAPTAATLQVDQLTAGYGGRAVVCDVSFELPAGQITAVVGENGAGKSTLLASLVAETQRMSGSIRWQGNADSDMPATEWRAQVAWVPQQPHLLVGTLAQNIAPNCAFPDQDRLRGIMRATGLLDFVASLRDGLQTQIGRHGQPLSAGQAQRIALVRALYKRAPLLVLDEPTAVLDGVSESELHRAITWYLREDPRHRVVLASHRLSAVLPAQHLVVLAEGRVIEAGDMHTLWQQRGLFYRLFRQQVIEPSFTWSRSTAAESAKAVRHGN